MHTTIQPELPFTMLLSTVLIGSLIVLPSTLAGSQVLDLVPSNFDKVVFNSGKASLVEFFAPWCGHCKTLAPIFDELAESFSSSSDQVNIAKVDADEHKKLGKKFDVHGYPTLKWFDGKSKTPVDYNGQRSLEALQAFINEKTGLKPTPKKGTASNVQVLTDQTFGDAIGKDRDVLVAFTAPWCGHCKTLAPTWETLAANFAAESSVLVAKVDAEAENSKATASSQGVSSYPTIKFFARGSSTGEPYTGGRSEPELLEFLNSKAGTYRAPGGGLNAKAGTIDALDALAAKLGVAGAAEKLSIVAGEAAQIAKDLKEKSVEYYLKVFAKLGQNSEYAVAEHARLQKMLAKGGISAEKMDDLTVRANILRRFVGKEGDRNEL